MVTNGLELQQWCSQGKVDRSAASNNITLQGDVILQPNQQ